MTYLSEYFCPNKGKLYRYYQGLNYWIQKRWTEIIEKFALSNLVKHLGQFNSIFFGVTVTSRVPSYYTGTFLCPIIPDSPHRRSVTVQIAIVIWSTITWCPYINWSFFRLYIVLSITVGIIYWILDRTYYILLYIKPVLYRCDPCWHHRAWLSQSVRVVRQQSCHHLLDPRMRWKQDN